MDWYIDQVTILTRGQTCLPKKGCDCALHGGTQLYPPLNAGHKSVGPRSAMNAQTSFADELYTMLEHRS